MTETLALYATVTSAVYYRPSADNWFALVGENFGNWLRINWKLTYI